MAETVEAQRGAWLGDRLIATRSGGPLGVDITYLPAARESLAARGGGFGDSAAVEIVLAGRGLGSPLYGWSRLVTWR